tara:strand:+ start:1991 stop:2746 length:756 start_codon:yes stop_codon:yes gene_type:complete
MTDIKVPSSGNIRVWWGLANAFANFEAPTATEINACLDVSESISWNDLGFGLQASNTIDDPAITAIGKVSDRGASQFSGAISFYYPGAFGDAGNDYSVTYDALDQPRTLGYLIMRVDGEQTATVAEAADLVQVFKVMTDGYAESITGEEAFRYTVSFLSQGDLAVRAITKGVGAITVVIPATVTIAVGESARITATVDGRNYTNGVKWSSSSPADVSVSTAGVITAVTAGSAMITATYEATGATDTCLVND